MYFSLKREPLVARTASGKSPKLFLVAHTASETIPRPTTRELFTDIYVNHTAQLIAAHTACGSSHRLLTREFPKDLCHLQGSHLQGKAPGCKHSVREDLHTVNA